MFHTLLIMLAAWTVLYAINKLIGSKYSPFKNLYAQCQDELGVSITFAHFRVYTTRFNSLFKVWGRCSRKLARLWFDVGVFVGLLLMGLSIVIMIFAIYQNLIKESGQSKEEQILTPLMPGVNLPWSEVGYYFVTIIVCGVFHEVGHALAAVTEQVRINGFGMFLLFIYPGAFVDLHSDHLTVISPRRQLRIYCAGVWHNVILSATMALFLQAIPYLLLPFYAHGQGAVVVSIDRDSVLFDKLQPGDAIIQIDSCQIDGTADWHSCIADITSRMQPGYCVGVDYLHSHQLLPLNKTTPLEDGSRECCPLDTKSNLCFSTINPTHHKTTDGNNKLFVCLTARQVLTTAVCHSNEECLVINSDSVCTTPTIATTRFNHLAKIRHTGSGDPVIFLGDLRTLLYNTKVSDFQPLSTSVSLRLPLLLQTTAIYMISISSALALLNMLPAYALDGQWALSAFMEHLLPEHPKRNKIVNGILTGGTLLLIMNIALGIWILINW